MNIIINPVLFGVLITLFTEFTLFFVWVVIAGINNSRGDKDE